MHSALPVAESGAPHPFSDWTAEPDSGDSLALGWPRRIAILNDYVRIPYANGSSFASQRFYRDFARRGHQVTIVGPHDPHARAGDFPKRYVLLPSLPLRNHPGVYLPFPGRRPLEQIARAQFDVALGQTGSELTELGLWMRARCGVPFVCVNTVHLPSVYDVVLPERLHRSQRVQRIFRDRIVPWLERHSVEVYNRSDGLVVLSRGLERYWRERGVHVPIHVIPRSVDRSVFEASAAPDPFSPRAFRGRRLLVICRHTREKSVERLLRLFALHVAPRHPEATLTLVGDGPDHDAFKALASNLGVADRCFFPGECGAAETPAWYRHADVFVYTSLSETYGQVVSEALWCGLPVVAFADDMGVSQQIDDGDNGFLIQPGPDEARADAAFAAAVDRLLTDSGRRAGMGQTARHRALDRSSPERALDRMYGAFETARRHFNDTRKQARSRSSAAWFLARWRGIHLLTFAAGLLRRPALLNRNQAQHPPWDELPPLPRAAIRGLVGPLTAQEAAGE